MHINHYITSLAAGLLLFTSVANASPSVRFDSDTNLIVGIENIRINTELWDATLSNQFTFEFAGYTDEFAEAATQSLWLDIFYDGGFADDLTMALFFDSRYVFEERVHFATPVETYQFAAEVGAYSAMYSVLTKDVDFGTISREVGSAQPDVAFLKWTKQGQVSAVPEPATAFMFTPALLLCLGLRRRAKQA